MSTSPKPLIFVVWQSLVVKSYRSFFYKLAEIGDAEIVLISPDKFKELGSQIIGAEAFAGATRCHGEILRVWSPHTQVVWYRGLTKLLRRYSKNQKYGPVFVLNLAEPYSLTSLLCWIQARIALGNGMIFSTYALQNIFKNFGIALGLVQRFVFSRCQFILSLGTEQSIVLRRHGFKGTILDFPLWYDSSRFKLTQVDHSRHKADRNRINIGFIGSLLAEKGILDIFDALEGLSSPSQFEFHLMVAGRGPLQAQVEMRCAKLSDQGIDCRFLGPLSADEVPHFFDKLDILIVPSRTAPHWKEQFGRVIIEAMACGCSVIGSDSGEIPHVIGQAEHIFKEAQPADLLRVLKIVSEKVVTGDDGFQVRKENAERSSRYSDSELALRFLAQIRAKQF